MSKILKYLSAFILFIGVTIGLLLIDDDLDTDVQKMYNEAIKHQESEAFTYLLGMQAAVDEDPMEVGKALLEEIRAADKKYLKGRLVNGEYDYKGYPENKSLPIFTLKECPSKETDKPCDYIDKLFNHEFDLQKLTKKQKILLDRFNIFLTKNDFHSITTPQLLTPFPQFQYILRGNDLNNLIAIQYMKKGDHKSALFLLDNSITHLRNHLAKADSLISKMIFVAALSNNLDVYSVLLQQNNETSNKDIKPLINEERSLKKAMNYEIGFIYNTFLLMGNDTVLSTEERNSGIYRYIPNLGISVLYKQNMTINNSVPLFKRIAGYSELSSNDFSKKLLENNPIKVKESYIRNYIGTILNQVSVPDFSQYIARIFAIDAKIILLNSTKNSTNNLADTNAIKNPFYPKEKEAYYTKDKKSICFDIPRIEQEKLRCLRVLF